ncbi:TIR domain-containing adapter molecule 1 [Talpa occidentalis]|uniref:TIR domain-containing adapter molecule 1 n=1 Tax=Talpa occidentalis TaxID=50954 RepID=UPI00188E357F|nr:TIR domain-containing adapter molecule 1 [Talpa occidentalis]XP_037361029.1 TIR domain-containing adapter molecule 1 [Talpa occidentalis]
MASKEPSLSDAFGILEAAGEGKLMHLKHKLKTLRPGCPRVGLLHAMVLLKLGQETEARISLDALKMDSVAQFVARQWAGVDSVEASEEPWDMSWAIAQVCHLLAEEKLCPAATRDLAYRAALRVFSSREDHRLGDLQEEARDRCGWDIIRDPGGFQPLHSDLGCLPPSSASPSRTRSLPQPIENLSGWSRGGSLKSTDSPASVVSDLEISQSPTMPFLSLPLSNPGPSKLCVQPQPRSVPEPACQQPEEMSWPPTVEPASPQAPPDSPPPRLPEVPPDASLVGLPYPSEAPERSPHYSVECTEVPVAPKSLPSPPRSARSVTDQTPLQLPEEDTTPPTAQPCPSAPLAPQTSPPCPSPSAPSSAHPGSSRPCPPPSKVELPEQKFYNFVVLHARADEHVALRVKEKLEGLGVSDGATFCEEFQVPGRGELHCLQDALDHSAFTILLLTPNFDCRLSLYQVNQSVMSSLRRHDWQDSVIPFLPEETSQDQLSPETSSLLNSMVWLDESSPVFGRKVANTFKSQKLQLRRDLWRKEQDTRALREQQQRLEQERLRVGNLSSAYSSYMQSQRALWAQMEQFQATFANFMPFGAQAASGAQVPLGGPPPFPTWPNLQPPHMPSWPTGIPPPPAFQEPPTFPQPSPVPPQSPGQQPLIIHHAHMVQLGLNNHMWNQRATPVPEDNIQEAE